MYPPRPSGTISMIDILVAADADDAAVVLTDEVARQHAMHQSVLALHQAVVAALQLQRADHAHGVERELLEELARALHVGAHGRLATSLRAGALGTNGERMLRRVVRERLVRLDLAAAARCARPDGS